MLFESSAVLTFVSCYRCGFRIGTVAIYLTNTHILNLIYSRAKEKSKARRLHQTDSVQTEAVLRDKSPEGQLNESFNPPDNTLSFTPSSPGSPIIDITDSTFSLWADDKPPLDSSYSLPNTRSDSGLGFVDVSSLCYGPLPVISTQMSRHIDPFNPRDSIVDGSHPLLKATGIYGGGIGASSESSIP